MIRTLNLIDSGVFFADVGVDVYADQFFSTDERAVATFCNTMAAISTDKAKFRRMLNQTRKFASYYARRAEQKWLSQPAIAYLKKLTDCEGETNSTFCQNWKDTTTDRKNDLWLLAMFYDYLAAMSAKNRLSHVKKESTVFTNPITYYAGSLPVKNTRLENEEILAVDYSWAECLLDRVALLYIKRAPLLYDTIENAIFVATYFRILATLPNIIVYSPVRKFLGIPQIEPALRVQYYDSTTNEKLDLKNFDGIQKIVNRIFVINDRKTVEQKFYLRALRIFTLPRMRKLYKQKDYDWVRYAFSKSTSSITFEDTFFVARAMRAEQLRRIRKSLPLVYDRWSWFFVVDEEEAE